jgi:hypothetical protein
MLSFGEDRVIAISAAAARFGEGLGGFKFHFLSLIVLESEKCHLMLEMVSSHSITPRQRYCKHHQQRRLTSVHKEVLLHNSQAQLPHRVL